MEGGVGGEAIVMVQSRYKFPGIGGTIVTQQGAVAALRIEKSGGPRQGHMTFLKHLIIKKLDDYFIRKGRYDISHIPRVFGSISRLKEEVEEGEKALEAYLYEWVYGSDGFTWTFKTEDPDHPTGFPDRDTELKEWRKFCGCFNYDTLGIDLSYDVTDSEDGRASKNIVHKLPDKDQHMTFKLNSMWKRIDFGSNSIRVNQENFSRFLRENKEDLKEVLGLDRYRMIRLAWTYLKKGKKLGERRIGHLEKLISQYRSKSLEHYSLSTAGRTQRRVYFEKDAAEDFNQGVLEEFEGGEGSEAVIKLQLRNRFPGVPWTVVTRQVAMAALREEHNSNYDDGYRMFIRHMIIKKLDDYFNRLGIYKVSHVPRVLGSISVTGENPYEAYLYEWAYGVEGFNWREGGMNIKLSEWDVFVDCFREAGVDLDSGARTEGSKSKNIIHEFPRLHDNRLNSMWKRIDYGFNSVKTDFDKLAQYFSKNEKKLTEILRHERLWMLQLGLDYLIQGPEHMDKEDKGHLDILVGNYRGRTLEHYSMGLGGMTRRKVDLKEGRERLEGKL